MAQSGILNIEPFSIRPRKTLHSNKTTSPIKVNRYHFSCLLFFILGDRYHNKTIDAINPTINKIWVNPKKTRGSPTSKLKKYDYSNYYSNKNIVPHKFRLIQFVLVLLLPIDLHCVQFSQVFLF